MPALSFAIYRTLQTTNRISTKQQQCHLGGSIDRNHRQMKKAGKSHGSKSSGKAEGRKDRKSGTGMSGSPKKGGHGGKYTWSGDGYSQAEIGYQREVLDARDPNFEDPEETVTV